MELLSRVPAVTARPHAQRRAGRNERQRQKSSGLRDGVGSGLHRASLSEWRSSRRTNSRGAGRPGSVRTHVARAAEGWRSCRRHQAHAKKRTGAGPETGATNPNGAKGAEGRDRRLLGRGNAGTPEAVVERLRGFWAFATSIDGLGIEPLRFWMLTLADYSALKKVYDDRRDLEFKRWAVERVDFRNAHRMFEEGVPWTLADMIGERDREAAVKEARSDKAKREMALMKLQRGLGSITSGKA